MIKLLRTLKNIWKESNMDLKAKYLSDTCSDPIEYLRQLRQTTEPIGGGTEYCEDGELVEYDVAIEAVKKANNAFIEKASWWIEENMSKWFKNMNTHGYKVTELMIEDFKKAMKL